MKIAYTSQVFNQPNTSGIKKYAINLLNSLNTLDSQNELICYMNAFNRKKLVKPVFNSNKIRIFVNPIPNKIYNTPVFNGYSLFPVDLFLGKVDILHYLHPPLALLPRFHGKSVLTIHDLTLSLFPHFHTHENIKLYDQYLPLFVKNVDMIIADSYSTKKDIISHLGVPDDKIAVVYLAVEESFKRISDTKRIDIVKKKYQIDGDYFFFLSTIEPRKNIMNLIKAFDWLVKKKNNHNISLVIGGKKGWLFEEIYTLTEKLNLSEKIKFIGYVSDDDSPCLYSGAMAAVYPSFYEGFGLPVLEALACETPVITSRVSSIPEVAGDAALLINPYDIESIAKSMLAVLESEKLRHDLSRKARIQASKFSLEKMAQDTLTVYNNLT